MRRPNGSGTIIKLSGNRRNPYAVKVSVRDKRGRVQQKYLSYHRTSADAQLSLDEYNRKRMGSTAPLADNFSMTMKDIYDLWSKRKFAKAGPSSVASYRASWVRLANLAPLRMRDITVDHLQHIIDTDEAAGLSKSSITNDKTLMVALFKFAMERDIVVKNCADFVELPVVGAKHEKGVFSDIQLKQLESMAADGEPWADTVLMLCYTGFRISEFLGLTRFSYDVEGNYLRGGVKTAAGKNRVVPVHPKIEPYLLARLEQSGDTIICDDLKRAVTDSWYRTHAFHPIVVKLGLPQATPHWCRHTFATRLHSVDANELDIKRLMGHANSNITEHYTHTDLNRLRAAIKKLA